MTIRIPVLETAIRKHTGVCEKCIRDFGIRLAMEDYDDIRYIGNAERVRRPLENARRIIINNHSITVDGIYCRPVSIETITASLIAKTARETYAPRISDRAMTIIESRDPLNPITK